MTLHFPKLMPRLRRPAPELLPDAVELAGRLLPLKVRRAANARRLVLRLAPGGAALRVTAPPRASAKSILDFIERHRPWAEARLAALPEPVAVADGVLLPFRGAGIRVVWQAGRRSALFESGGEEPTLFVGGEPQALSRRVVDFFKREARRDLQAAVERHAAAVGMAPRSLSLKDTRSRWGSCTQDRRLAFSWRIVMAPPHVLDYLAAHEVAHFRQMNHGPAFWALCRELCPSMDEGRDWLKRNGAGLQAIHFALDIE